LQIIIGEIGGEIEPKKCAVIRQEGHNKNHFR